MTATGGAPGRSSSGMRSRPAAGDNWRAVKNPPLTQAPGVRTGADGGPTVNEAPLNPPKAAKTSLRSASAWITGYEKLSLSLAAIVVLTCTSSPGFGTGSGRTSKAYRRLKMAVFAPMPKARDKTAIAVKLRLAASNRNP